MNTSPQDLNKENTQIDIDLKVGGLTETAPANDTASSGLNGRLQRIAQRLTSIFTALSDKTSFFRLTDGTNDGTVKAASTPATATDTSIVVSVNPNTPISVSPLDGTRDTYSATTLGLSPVASPTDIWTITGSNTKIIRVSSLRISGTRTSAGNIDLLVIKRSTANTGGTSAVEDIVPHDSTNPAATAVVRSYTANPTLGTLVGSIRDRKTFISNVGGMSDNVLYEWGSLNQMIVLNNASEQLSINLNGVSVAGGSFNISVEFIEE